jgi:NAD-dependent SIR2 family protein deacetylase
LLKDRHSKVIVFSGAGISVSSGIPTYYSDTDSSSSSSTTSLYSQAARTFGLQQQQGSNVFCYSFWKSHPQQCFAFFQSLYGKVIQAVPTPTHHVLERLATTGKLLRHYTLNIDGLASSECRDMSVWTPSHNNNNYGTTIELHGNLRELVCPSCGTIVPVSAATAAATTAAAGSDGTASSRACRNKVTTKDKKDSGGTTTIIPKCQHCHEGKELRFRVLLYDDDQSHLICPCNPLIEVLPHDLKTVDAIVWVGISFRQSASCHHFEVVYNTIMTQFQHRKKQLPSTFLIDPQPQDVLDNLMDGLQMNLEEDKDNIYTIESTSDAFFSQIIT